MFFSIYLQKSTWQAPSSVAPDSSPGTTRDEIYIDDEGLEGSGGRGEVNIYNSLYTAHFLSRV